MSKFLHKMNQQRLQAQAMVEYALILAFVCIGLIVVLTAQGPAIANVFCNVIANIVPNDSRYQECGRTNYNLANEGGNVASFWQTVTWVAQNPQTETPFRTPPPPPARPTSTAGAVVPPTATPTFTPSNTPTNTATATLITPGPSPTPEDFLFSLPFIDQMNETLHYRLDKSYVLSTADFTGVYYVNPNFSGATHSANTSFIDFDWGAGEPGVAGWPAGDTEFSVEWTKLFTTAQPQRLTFSLTNVSGTAEVVLNGTSLFSTTSANSATVNVPAGANQVVIRFRDSAGDARITFNAERASFNPDDATTAECTWGQSTYPSHTSDSNSPGNMFEENPASDIWPAGQTCYLELRGGVEIDGATNPILSFWDVWDFTGTGDVVAELQVGQYVVDGDDFLLRDQLNWQTLSLRSGNTANYNWTRNQIDLQAAFPSIDFNQDITFRFRLSSATGGSLVRWFVDDVQIFSDPNATNTFTVDNTWDLNTRDQMSDFIFNADTSSALETDGRPPASSAWRWNLTNTNAVSGLGWEDSPGGLYPRHSLGGPRVHYLEFRYPIDVSNNRVPETPAIDENGNTGDPVLTFWHAYNLTELGSSLQVQYTHDLYGVGPDSWQFIPSDGLLLDSAAPTPPLDRNEQVDRVNTMMQPVQVRLNQIPNWDTAPFRLRFALIVDDAAPGNDGWWIDNIGISRNYVVEYVAFPFADSAESAAFTTANWNAIGDWGRMTGVGAAGSATAYSDSRAGNFGTDPTRFEMIRTLDLLNDTEANTVDPEVRPASTSPFLTFQFRRASTSGTQFAVDLWSGHTGTWTTIWTYNNDGPSTQLAYERVEIDLKGAIIYALNTETGETTWQWDGATATSIVGNTIDDDDDIRIRFRVTPGPTQADGFYVDEIRIDNLAQYSHRLWNGTVGSFGVGNGELNDSIDTISNSGPANGLPTTWANRWFQSGGWTSVDPVSGYTRSGSTALHDSYQTNAASPVNYGANQVQIIEYRPVIDLRGTVTNDNPYLEYWLRGAIGAGDQFRVEVAVENTTDSGVQTYNNMHGWNAWASVNTTAININPVANLTAGQLNTWHRAHVDLSAYLGQRIRIRWVLESNGMTEADGIYLDDVRLRMGAPVMSLPFTEDGATSNNWVSEGTWGFSPDQASASAIPLTWTGYYFDCETLAPTGNCATPLTYSTILSAQNHPPTPATGITAVDTLTNVNEINYTYTDTSQPLGLSGSLFNQTYTARYRTTVTLTPGTYSVYTQFDDGVRIYLDNRTGTNLATNNIVYQWDQGSAVRTLSPTFTVNSTITRTLTVEWYVNTITTDTPGRLQMALYRNLYSYTDSPNTPTGVGTYNTISSTNFGYSSLISNGAFNFTTATNPVLQYSRRLHLAANSQFAVQVSTNYGRSWTTVGSVVTGAVNTMANPWEIINIPLTAYAGQPAVMIRFNLNTLPAGLPVGVFDGAHVGNISISN